MTAVLNLRYVDQDLGQGLPCDCLATWLRTWYNRSNGREMRSHGKPNDVDDVVDDAASLGWEGGADVGVRATRST